MIEWLPIISTIAGLTTFAAGALTWYRGSITKGYAAQRDFEHLRRNQQQMADGLGVLMDELKTHLRTQDKEVGNRFDTLHRELLEVKSMFYSSLHGGKRE